MGRWWLKLRHCGWQLRLGGGRDGSGEGGSTEVVTTWRWKYCEEFLYIFRRDERGLQEVM